MTWGTPREASVSRRSLSWNGKARKGTYTLAPGLTDYTVIDPDGDTPTEADYDSHRYRHHTYVATSGARLWVMWSSSGTNEDGGGQMVVGKSTPKDSPNFAVASPIQICPPQSTWTGTAATAPGGTARIAWPRCFAYIGSDLYAIIAIQNGDVSLALALAARKCNDDGTLGSLFLISPATYTPNSGFPSIPYDNVLGPQLLPYANLYGIWGGNAAGVSADAPWIGWVQQNSLGYVEPSTIEMGDNVILQLWRATNQQTTWLHERLSRDGGATWGPLSITDIPNQPSSTSIIRLTDGRIALVGNAQDRVNFARDPLYLALFDGEFGVCEDIYAVRQGIGSDPTYPGSNKAGGAAYPCAFEDGDYLWVSYSIHKESIGLTRIALAGI